MSAPEISSKVYEPQSSEESIDDPLVAGDGGKRVKTSLKIFLTITRENTKNFLKAASELDPSGCTIERFKVPTDVRN